MSEPHKILLVEDNELNREMLSRRLERKGFEVILAVDGLEGVAKANQDMPDLILMDMSLPGIDGWEATRRIKANPLIAHTPIIALTAHAMAEDRQQAHAAGCDEFDTKPVDLPRLLEKINRLLPSSASSVVWQKSLSVLAHHDELPVLKAALIELLTRVNASPDLRADMMVVLDEVCSNIFKHAYPVAHLGSLEVQLVQSRDEFAMIFTDKGQAFNPLQREAPDLSQESAQRPIGGLGVHLIKQMTDHQIYSYSAVHGNALKLVKRWP